MKFSIISIRNIFGKIYHFEVKSTVFQAIFFFPFFLPNLLNILETRKKLNVLVNIISRKKIYTGYQFNKLMEMHNINRTDKLFIHQSFIEFNNFYFLIHNYCLIS